MSTHSFSPIHTQLRILWVLSEKDKKGKISCTQRWCVAYRIQILSEMNNISIKILERNYKTLRQNQHQRFLSYMSIMRSFLRLSITNNCNILQVKVIAAQFHSYCMGIIRSGMDQENVTFFWQRPPQRHSSINSP